MTFSLISSQLRSFLLHVLSLISLFRKCEGLISLKALIYLWEHVSMERYPTTRAQDTGRQLSDEIRSDSITVEETKCAVLCFPHCYTSTAGFRDYCCPSTISVFLNDPHYLWFLPLSPSVDVGLTWITVSPSLIGLQTTRHQMTKTTEVKVQSKPLDPSQTLYSFSFHLS